MATKEAPLYTTQRYTSPPGLLAFVPLKEQNDFSNYLYSQFRLWNKERRRCFYQARRFYKHSNPKIFELTSSFSSSNSSTSTLLTPSLRRSESVTTIRTSFSKTFSLSTECTSAVIRFTLSHKRSPWMESEKILRKIQRPSPPTSHARSSARYPLSRVQVPSRPAAPSKQDSSSSYRSALLARNSSPPTSRPSLSGQPSSCPSSFTKDASTSSIRPSPKIFIDPSSHCYPGPVEELPLQTQIFLATLQDYDLPFPKVKDSHHSKSPGRKKGKKRK